MEALLLLKVISGWSGPITQVKSVMIYSNKGRRLSRVFIYLFDIEEGEQQNHPVVRVYE